MTIFLDPNKVVHHPENMVCISLQLHKLRYRKWAKAHYTLSSSGASPRDFRYAVKTLSSEFPEQVQASLTTFEQQLVKNYGMLSLQFYHLTSQSLSNMNDTNNNIPKNPFV